VLGGHPEVHAIEWESRFLVDPGGFEDLVRALTVAYSPYHADDALTRLAWLLSVRLTGHSQEAFRGWGLAGELGGERYQAAVDRLWRQLELFPLASVVVIMRHPEHVAASHLDQFWAPSTLGGVLAWLEPVYQRWLAQRPALLADSRYAEVKAESLAEDWPGGRRRLFERLGLPDAETTATFEARHLAARNGQLSAAEQAEVASRLGWAAEELGYQSRP
jgi:sulfotransferase family protein